MSTRSYKSRSSNTTRSDKSGEMAKLVIKSHRNGNDYLQLDVSRMEKSKGNDHDNRKRRSTVQTTSRHDDDFINNSEEYIQLDISKLQIGRFGDEKSISTAPTTLMEDDSTILSDSLLLGVLDASQSRRRSSMSLSQRTTRKMSSVTFTTRMSRRNSTGISAIDMSRSSISTDGLSISLSRRSEGSRKSWISVTEDDDFYVDPLSISRRSDKLSSLPREIEFNESDDDDYYVDHLAISRGSTRIRQLPREIELDDEDEFYDY